MKEEERFQSHPRGTYSGTGAGDPYSTLLLLLIGPLSSSSFFLEYMAAVEANASDGDGGGEQTKRDWR